MAIMKSCNYTRCRTMVEYGIAYCEKHKVEIAEEHKQDYKNYKARRTDKIEEAFYNTKGWTDTKELGKARTYCIDIYEYYTNNKITQGDTVHHIICLKDDGGWEHRLDVNNLIYLTYESHAIVHARYNRGPKEKKIMQKLLFNLINKFKNEFA